MLLFFILQIYHADFFCQGILFFVDNVYLFVIIHPMNIPDQDLKYLHVDKSSASSSTMKITIEFDDGTTRKYVAVKGINDLINKGWTILFELCHPKFGEIFRIKQGYHYHKPTEEKE